MLNKKTVLYTSIAILREREITRFTDSNNSSCNELRDHDISGNVQLKVSSAGGVEEVSFETGLDCGTDKSPGIFDTVQTIVCLLIDLRLGHFVAKSYAEIKCKRHVIPRSSFQFTMYIFYFKGACNKNNENNE